MEYVFLDKYLMCNIQTNKEEHFIDKNHLYAIVFVCHNEKTTYDSLQKWPNSFVIFVGSQPLTKMDPRIIIARDQPDNIEHIPKLLTFTAWYLIIKNNLFHEYKYLCIFEYDIMIHPSFNQSLTSLLEQRADHNTIVGFISDSHCFLCDVNKNVLHKLNIAQTKENCKTTYKFYSNKDSNVLTRLLNNDHLEILSKEF